MSYFVNNLLYDPRTSGSFHLRSRIYKPTLSSPEHAPAYMMAANAGVIKAIVSFSRFYSDTAFGIHRSRIPMDDLRYQYTPNDGLALSLLHGHTFHKNPNKVYIF